MAENNQSKNFSWETEKTFPMKTFKGLGISGSIQKSVVNGKKQLAIKKVSLDAGGFPTGEVKHLWIPLDAVENVADYLYDCIKK